MTLTTPITLLYASLNALLFLFLSIWVVRKRLTHKVELGDGNKLDLLRVIRVQANAAEYIPLVLLLLFILEINHASNILLQIIGASLFGGRILHAYGLNKTSAPSFGRFVGTILTWISLLSATIGCIYLILQK